MKDKMIKERLSKNLMDIKKTRNGTYGDKE